MTGDGVGSTPDDGGAMACDGCLTPGSIVSEREIVDRQKKVRFRDRR